MNVLECTENGEQKDSSNLKSIDYSNYKIIAEEKIFEEDQDGNRKEILVRIVEFDRSKISRENKIKYIKKYTAENKEEINKKILEINKNRYKNDEEYREYIKRKRREYYQKNKK